MNKKTKGKKQRSKKKKKANKNQIPLIDAIE